MKKNSVFFISITACIIVAIIAICFNEQFVYASGQAFSYLTDSFSWLYLIVMLIFVIFDVVIAMSRYGNIRLGDDDDKPEYSTMSWFAMLFCAGMGVGLVFWGISEPISHYINPIDGIRAETAEAAEFAFKSVFMHWGFHAWAAYCVIGLALAYAMFRKKRSGLMSSAINLKGGKHLNDKAAYLIDVLASFATVAGVVTSLGLGVLQLNKGLEMIFHISNNIKTQTLIIVIITIIFIASAVSGINKGVKFLSNITLVVAALFMLICFIFGPKVDILNNLVTGIGNYFNDFFRDSITISPYTDSAWIKNWRVFYWAWWIAWAPFVGIFIARISKGRTIREFVMGVVLAPTLASLLWFAVFGTLGINMGMNNIISSELMEQIAGSPETGLFIVLQKYPFGMLASLMAIFLLISFYITSADSGTFVLAMLSSNGDMEPSRQKKILWGCIQAVLAIGLLLSGGLKPLQTISIVAAFPFIFVMLGSGISLMRSLKKEDI